MSRRTLGLAAALAGPSLVTLALVPLGNGLSRDYIFAYLAVVSILAVISGLVPALLAAAVSFLLVDYFLVAPVHTLTIADQTDVINLVVFFGTAGLVGGLGSRRRRAQLDAEALSGELRRANVQLERLNREQAEAAATAVRLARTEQQVHALEETDRLRAELLANVSHELRTPLSTILTGATDLLGDDDLSPTARRRVESTVTETVRLSRLVSDMLDLSRIEGRALRLDPDEVDVREAVEAAVERLHQSSPNRAVTVDVAEPLDVMADWGRLGQILDNLLRNADAYSPPDTAIRVEATPGKRSMVVIRVIDRGPGIALDQRERVFERFVRSADNTVYAGNSGTGLGLAIVRGLVEAHAGRVWVEEPRNGEGTRLAFSLPAAAPSVVAGEDVHVDVDE
jgi:two-component system, OmpR family, sensor histidine kinase KdpD